VDINTWRGIATVLALIAFIGVWIWAWSKKRKGASKGGQHDGQ
jgi:cytochrome c oxidase cbb3-type subunit 4